MRSFVACASIVLVSLVAKMSAGKILVLPMHHLFNSRLVSMERMAEILVEEGHDVVLMGNNRTQSQLTGKGYQVLTFTIPESLPDINNEQTFQEIQNLTPLDLFHFYRIWFAELVLPWCEAMLKQRGLLAELKRSRFDLLIYDVVDDCNRILVDYLDVASISYSNYGFHTQTEVFFSNLPMSMTFLESSLLARDEMTFAERSVNYISFAASSLMYEVVFSDLDAIRRKLNLNSSLTTRYSHERSMTIATINYVLDFPHPTMPYVVALPGPLHESSAILPKMWAEWMDASDEGVLVVSFGKTLHNWTDYAAEAAIFNHVFGLLPLRIVWQITEGLESTTISRNIRAETWIPRNALLAHRNARAFVTHAGTSATYEAINNSLPVLCVPLFGHQHRNTKFLVERNAMGLALNFKRFKEAELEEKLLNVIGDTRFRNAARLTGRKLRDTPRSARQTFLWWTDYVIRYHGAPHLTSTPARRLAHFQLIGLDVIATFLLLVFVLLSVAAGVLLCVVQCCRAVFVLKAKHSKTD